MIPTRTKLVQQQETNEKVLVQFESADKQQTQQLLIPLNSTQKELDILLNKILEQEYQPHSFFINQKEFADLHSFLKQEKISTEQLLNIVYQPQAVFKVRTVTRCSTSLQGTFGSLL